MPSSHCLLTFSSYRLRLACMGLAPSTTISYHCTLSYCTSAYTTQPIQTPKFCRYSTVCTPSRPFTARWMNSMHSVAYRSTDLFVCSLRDVHDIPNQNSVVSSRRDSARRLGHSKSRDKKRTYRTAMAVVASNTMKECDTKALLKSIHRDLDAGAW